MVNKIVVNKNVVNDSMVNKGMVNDSTQTVFPADGPDKRFRDYLQQGDFRIQHCHDCQQHIYYPRQACPHCGSAQLTWTKPSGRGTVYSTSVARTKNNQGNYNIALVDLEEGPRMLTRVVNIAPEKVTIGMEVQAFISPLEGSDQPLVLFKPASSTEAVS